MRPMPPPLGPSVRRGALGPPPWGHLPTRIFPSWWSSMRLAGDGSRARAREGTRRGRTSRASLRLRRAFALAFARPPPPACGPGRLGGCVKNSSARNLDSRGRPFGRSRSSSRARSGCRKAPRGRCGTGSKKPASSSQDLLLWPVPDIPSQRSRQRQKSRQVETGLSGSHQRGQGREGRARAGRVHRPGRALRAHSARPPRARRAAKEEGGDLGRGPAAEARARREGREGRGPQWRGPALRPPPPPPPLP